MLRKPLLGALILGAIALREAEGWSNCGGTTPGANDTARFDANVGVSAMDVNMDWETLL